MEIFKLQPVGKDYIWGGTRLREEYGKKINLTPLAETWECSVHPDGQSVVANGSFHGETLARVLSIHPEYLGTRIKNGEMPVLIKFIDAKQDLSVQVHPDDAYAQAYEHQNGKTEMWYVLDAQEGASLIYGFQHMVTPEILREAIQTGTLGKHLHRISVHRGDVFYVPAGTVHGIGAGILLVEIQESSDVTYRVYDYDRVDKMGKKRQLHFDKAMQVMNLQPTKDVTQRLRKIHYYPGCSRELLCRCRYFEAERITISRELTLSALKSSFQVLLCFNGSGKIEVDGAKESLLFDKGDCVFIPAEAEEEQFRLVGHCELLKVHC